MAQPSRRDQGPTTDRRYLWAAGIVLIIPMIAIGAVPTYAKAEPTFAGWPFFFWYQTLWVILTACCTVSAHALVKKARRHRDGGRA